MINQRTAEEEAQFIKMTQTPIGKLISSLALPTIVSMLITSIYNMADTFFVARLGTSATGAVGVVFSLMAIIQAVGFTLGMGCGSLSSRLLGQGKKDEASEIGSTAFFTALLAGLLLTVFGLRYIEPFMHLLGATETIVPYAIDYAKYILYGAPIMCASFVLNNLLRAQGKAVMSMIGIGFGGLLNCVLDPIFIFNFNLGIAGAAIATVLSQLISFSILLYFAVFSGKSIVKISFANMSRSFDIYRRIITTGAPSFFRQSLASAATVVLNNSAAVYGDPAVAAMSVVTRITMFVFSFMLGFGQGFQPVVGYNYGAGKYKRVRESFWFTVKVGTIALGTMAVIGFIFAPQAIGLFRKEDLEVVAIGAFTLRAHCLGLPLIPFYTACNMTFQTTGESGKATVLALARQGLFFIPFVLILSNILGLRGIQISQACADYASCGVAIFFAMKFFKELKIKEESSEGEMDASTYVVDEFAAD